MRIRASRYYKIWHDMRHLKDIAVCWYIMHQWTPVERRLFDSACMYRDWQYGADGLENGEDWDYRFVEDNTLVSREPADVSKIYDIIKSETARFNTVAVTSVLQINGIQYDCIGRDDGSAKMLYSILSTGISDDQINYLKQDILNKAVSGPF